MILLELQSNFQNFPSRSLKLVVRRVFTKTRKRLQQKEPGASVFMRSRKPAESKLTNHSLLHNTHHNNYLPICAFADYDGVSQENWDV